MKKVVFLCDQSPSRCQMAEGFMRRFGKDVSETSGVCVHSAGMDDALASAVMRERGIEVAPLSGVVESGGARKIDVCAHFGLGEKAGEVGAAEVLDWGDIPDPAGKQYSEYRRTREEIGSRVMALIRRLRESG